MKQPIPTNLILGFLGVGKTTAIIDLLKHKPADEVWAVLVNEFGEVGIDGALLEQEGALSVVSAEPGASSRLEVISGEALPADELNEQLKQLIVCS